MKVLAKVLTHSALVELAGERYFERGEQYHREGLARIFAAHRRKRNLMTLLEGIE